MMFTTRCASSLCREGSQRYRIVPPADDENAKNAGVEDERVERDEEK
jgi:hypothetical protein